MKRYLLPVILAGLLTACANEPIYPPAPAKAAGASEWMYLLGPGDSINVFVWGNPEVSGSFPIRPDGKVTMHLVEDLQASGKTPSQLARDLEKNYATYVKSPVVTVTVNGFVGLPSQQVRVVGGAAEPGAIPFRRHMTMLDLMIAVGGLTDFAAGNRSVLVRYVDDQRHQYNVRLEDLIRDGDISADVSLLPGDILIIPEAWF